MFGNKQNKQKRLQKLAQKVFEQDGISQNELAKELGVSKGTISKDLAVVEGLLNVRFWQDDDDRLYGFSDDEES